MSANLPVRARSVVAPAPQSAEDYVVALLAEYGEFYGVPYMVADSVAAWPDPADELLLLACLRAKLQGVVPQILRDGPAGCSPLDALALTLLDWRDVTTRVLRDADRTPAPWDAPGDGARGRDRDGGDVLAVARGLADELAAPRDHGVERVYAAEVR